MAWLIWIVPLCLPGWHSPASFCKLLFWFIFLHSCIHIHLFPYTCMHMHSLVLTCINCTYFIHLTSAINYIYSINPHIQTSHALSFICINLLLMHSRALTSIHFHLLEFICNYTVKWFQGFIYLYFNTSLE